MGIQLQSSLSSTTISVLFDGVDVGALQSVTFEEGFDLRPVNEIGSNYTPIYAPGIFRGTIRAQRGILELDKMLQQINPHVSKEAIEGKLNSITANKSATLTISDYVSFFNTNVTQTNYPYIFAFDIEIKDISNITLHKFENCYINSRRLTINNTSLLIMQDIDITYSRRIK